jgi:hypothetical protein
MKIKYVFLSLLLSLAGLFGSCQDLKEDPKANLIPETYFATPEELEGALAAMYRQLCPDNAWGFTGRMVSTFGADDITTHPASNKIDMRNFDRLQGDAGNGSLRNMWEGPWKAIYQANAIIDVIDNVAFRDQEQRNSAVGQAYFIRGLGFFYLTRVFGEIPLVTAGIDVDDRPDRQPVKDVYAQVIADLTEAEALLPAAWNVGGKATRWAAKAVLSEVYLTMAGWPLKEENNYALSSQKAKEVIDSGKFDLVDDYADVFKTNNNEESVFSLQYNVAGGLPMRFYGSCYIPGEEEDLNGNTGWCDLFAEINFYKKAPKCKRTDDTFYTTLKLKVKGTSDYDLVDWMDPRTDQQHPYYKKFRYGVAEPGTTMGDGCRESETQLLYMNPSTDKTFDVIRYAGVLLNYAEASAMSGGVTADSYSAINQVRKRAGLPNLTSGLSQTAFRDSVVFERAYELAGEFGYRWYDIVRLQMLPQIIAEREKGKNPHKDQDWENTLNATFTSGERLQTRYMAPIPLTELERNPSWTQNAGYE